MGWRRGKAIANHVGDRQCTMRQAEGVGTMQTRIRIIKRGERNSMNEVAANPIAKSARERERERVNTVKGWIGEWQQRQRALQIAANSLIRSMRDPSETPTKPFAVVN
jgi:hypothetical protein